MNVASANYADTRVAHYATRVNFPTVGNAAQLYYDDGDNALYGWAGTAYKQLTGVLPPAPSTGDPSDLVALKASYDSTGALVGYSWVKTKIHNETGV